MNWPPEEPTNLMEWLWRLRQYEANIYVRQQDTDGKWGNVAMADLTPEAWAGYAARWLADGSLPIRVRRDVESDMDGIDLDGMTMAAAAERDHRAACFDQLLAALRIAKAELNPVNHAPECTCERCTAWWTVNAAIDAAKQGEQDDG